MGWNETQFRENASKVYQRYPKENGWFKWGNSPGAADEERHISNAWKLYRAASQNTLEFLILGDDKIRKSPDLLMNFGLASGSGVSDKGDLAVIQTQEQRRAAAAVGAKAAPKPVAVVGSGSILNDQSWTPLLNDSYILAGAHGRQEFQWAAEDFDKEFGASSKSESEKWRSFAGNHSVFWGGDNKEIPRVFGRELIGLSTFGYLPRFTKVGIVFKWSFKPKVDPTFEAYLNALAAAKFQEMNKASINATLGEFLFGEEGALTAS